MSMESGSPQGVRPAGAYMAQVGGSSQPSTLVDVLERVLDKGIIIAGDIQVNLLEIELLTIHLRLLIASVDKAQEMGIDWWRNDPMLRASERDLQDENRQLKERIEELDVRPDDPERQYQALSGGNQQKVVVSGCLGTDPHILVLDEPTTGVDVGARATLYQVLRERASQGLAVLVCSSDAAELATLCDRVIVLAEG